MRIKDKEIFLYHEKTFNNNPSPLKVSFLCLFFHGLNILFLQAFGDFRLPNTIKILAYSYLNSQENVILSTILHGKQWPPKGDMQSKIHKNSNFSQKKNKRLFIPLPSPKKSWLFISLELFFHNTVQTSLLKNMSLPHILFCFL